MNVLMCPFASHGFLYPMIGIAEELRRRGHEVRFVTGPAFTAVIAEAGFVRIPRGEPGGDSFGLVQWGHPLVVGMQIKHVEYAIQRFSPDVLFTSMQALGPLVVAERERIPVAILGLACYLWPTERGREDERTAATRRWRYDETMQHYERVREMAGLAPRPSTIDETPLLGDLYMEQSVAQLEPLTRSLPARVHLVGSCLWEPPAIDADLARWLARIPAGEPLAYLQHGPSFGRPGFWSNLVAALDGERVCVAAALGRFRETAAPSDRFFVRSHLPQGQVLTRASAVISGGNTTSVLGALTNGLPSLLVPEGGEQPDLATRCESAGVSVVVQRTANSPEALRSAVCRVLTDRALRERARRVRHAFVNVDGRGMAADLLTGLAVAEPQRAGTA